MSENKQKSPVSVIMKRELKSYFSGPIAYIVTGLFLIISGIMCFIYPHPFFLYGRAELRYYFSILPFLLALFIPAITMRIFAEEKRSGSIETLMTLPVTEVQVVAGKTLAAFIESLIMIAPTLFYIVVAAAFGEPDYGPIIGGFIGAVFLCASYCAIGVFSSSLTKLQIVGFAISCAICFILAALNVRFLMFLPTPIVNFCNFISANTHFSSISMGIIDTRDILYFVSLTALFFVLSVRSQKRAKN